jgi:hypothetical protein
VCVCVKCVCVDIDTSLSAGIYNAPLLEDERVRSVPLIYVLLFDLCEQRQVIK